ncbi:hypothetical protein ACFY3U_13820 [Micromonospora sp. NPDC000089]|uniref:hypothetical protein n=1 Tax=unclassified Micromonospora TaxID=2617518 RepID=UPI00369E2056
MLQQLTNPVLEGALDGEITDHLGDDKGDPGTAGRPERTRFLVRRERPHPGAQLSLFDTVEGWRHQVVATDTPTGNGSAVRERGSGEQDARIASGVVVDTNRWLPRHIRAVRRSVDGWPGRVRVPHAWSTPIREVKMVNTRCP